MGLVGIVLVLIGVCSTPVNTFLVVFGVILIMLD